MSYAADLNLNLATRGRTRLTALLTSATAVVKRTRKRVRPARLVRPR